MPITKNTLLDLWGVNSYGLFESLKSELLVATGKGGKFTCRDYQVAIATVSAARKFSSLSSVRACKTKRDILALIPPAYRFRLSFYTPCLAFRYNELKSDMKEQVFANSNWVFSQKLDGCRVVFVMFDGRPYLFGRAFSYKDSTVEDLWDNFNLTISPSSLDPVAVDMEITCDAWRWLSDVLYKLFNLTTYCCSDTVDAFMHLSKDQAELVLSNYNAEFSGDLFTFNVLLPLFYRGYNFMTRKIGDAFPYIDMLVKDLRSFGLNAKRVLYDALCTKDSKLSFLNTMLSLGFEGVVAYNLDATYNTSELRSHKTFIKIKRGWDKENSIGDTIDAYVSDIRMSGDVVSALELSVDIAYSGGVVKPTVIAVCTGMSAGFIKNPAYQSDDNYVADSSYVGRVAELEYSGYSVSTKLLVKPHIKRWRFDKTSVECVYPVEALDLIFK